MAMVDPLLVGYCTNVHAGEDLETTQAQLEQHAVEVANQLQIPHLAVGLWLSRKTSQQLLSTDSAVGDFSDWLNRKGLIPYTLNGFPFGNFHQEVVKQEVYLPTWADPARLNYTSDLATILVQLLKRCQQPAAHTGTISTLPLGWPETGQDIRKDSARNLMTLVQRLDQLHQESGIHIQVCIEPEPGCVLGDMNSTLDFFEHFLLTGDLATDNRIRQYLSVCYDICHSAVMGENATENLNRIRELQLDVGKVQVSSAVTVDFDRQSDQQQHELCWQRLTEFNEPRYLHQTCVFLDGQRHFFEDLPLALATAPLRCRGRWTVHFHVPISESAAGDLQTTQCEITEFISACQRLDVHPIHWEVETYAWNVLPADMQRPTLAEGIADEIRTLKHWLGIDTPG